jgi:predicted type IV restriction endonuclease
MIFNTLKEYKMSLESFINNKKKHNLNPLTEDQIKQGTILPLLKELGWNIHDVINEVVPEFSTDTLKVGYALKNNGKLLVLIEAKRGSENLENHQEQLLTYSFKHGVELATLTNGLEWWFYLPLNKGNWTNRRFFTISLNNQETQSIILNFKKFLGKEEIISGKSIKNANEIYKSKKIKEALEKTWIKMINEEDGDLVALIVKKVEHILDYKPDNAFIKKFLKLHYDTNLKEFNKNLDTKPISNNLNKINNNQNKELQERKL